MRSQKFSSPVAAGLLAMSLCATALLNVTTAGAEGDYFVYVGSYTDAPSQSKGIYAWRFSPVSGAIAPLGLVAETVNPAYVNATPNNRFLYATNWQTADAAKGDTMSAYAYQSKHPLSKKGHRAR